MRHKPGSCLLPFAVGVLGLDGDPADDELRRRGRLDLALDAYVLGYFLLDTIEVQEDGTGYALAEALAEHTEADAYVIAGPLDPDRLRQSADRLRMRVRSTNGRRR
jgi:hypothetical protein